MRFVRPLRVLACLLVRCSQLHRARVQRECWPSRCPDALHAWPSLRAQVRRGAQKRWQPSWPSSRALPPTCARRLSGGARPRRRAWHSWQTSSAARMRHRCGCCRTCTGCQYAMRPAFALLGRRDAARRATPPCMWLLVCRPNWRGSAKPQRRRARQHGQQHVHWHSSARRPGSRRPASCGSVSTHA